MSQKLFVTTSPTSTDGRAATRGDHMTLQLGDTAPDFTAETTEGELSFYEWLGNQNRGFTTLKSYLRVTPQPSR
jgi:hypothetical protein